MSLFIAFVTTIVFIYLLKPVAPSWGLVDFKDHRKLHAGDIPLVGGIAMYLGILLSALTILPMTWISMTWLFTAAGIVSLGVWDDAKDLPVRPRLLIQAMMTLLLSIGSGYYLADLGNILGLGNVVLGNLGYLITALAVIGAINAFNMMDGIDGLAGSMAFVSFSALAVLFGLNGDTYGLTVAILFLVVIVPFLANNLLLPPYKQKIFMGDAGAMLIGFSVVWLLIYGSQSIPQDKEISFRPVTALWIIAIPLMDMAAIMMRRIRKGQSPFVPDRDHLHHIFMHAGFSTRQTLLIISVFSMLFATCGIVAEKLEVPDNIMLIGFLLLFLGYNHLLKHAWKFSKLLHKSV